MLYTQDLSDFLTCDRMFLLNVRNYFILSFLEKIYNSNGCKPG